MIFVFRSFRMISLKSFCALRQTLGGALQGYVSVPTLGCITPPCVHFLLTNNVDQKYQTQISPIFSYCSNLWENKQMAGKMILRHILQKISIYNSNEHFYTQSANLLVESIDQMFKCKRCKKSGCVREELDLEAKRCKVRKREYFIFLGVVQRSVLTSDLSSEQRKTHSMNCGISWGWEWVFRRVVHKSHCQDKNKIRARSLTILNVEQ